MNFQTPYLTICLINLAEYISTFKRDFLT